jgi:hypothetical protein
MAVHRNRVIYQSEALFISPDGTGYHFTGAEAEWPGVGKANWGLMTPPTGAGQLLGGSFDDPALNSNGHLMGWVPGQDWPEWNPTNEKGVGEKDGLYAQNHGSIIKQLKRVQSANYGFTINRQDINQFGHATRLDSVIVESPTVNLDFSYYLLDGYNERLIEFVTDGKTNAFSGLLTPELYQAGNNFFIVTVGEGRDLVGGDRNTHADGEENEKTVISLGNGYVTDYSVDISVGSIPTASVTVEGMNIKTDIGTTGNDLPAVDMKDGSRISDAWETILDPSSKSLFGRTRKPKEGSCTGLYSIPAAKTGYTGCNDGERDVAALRPGDVIMNLSDNTLLHSSTSGNGAKPVIGSAHIQSLNISVPMGRTTLQRLGSTFGFAKAVDLPMTCTFSVSAMVADMKEGNVMDLMCSCEKYNVEVELYEPDCAGCKTKTGTPALTYTLKGAQLESENYSSSIGDNKMVDVVFTAQVGGADDFENGLFISGKESDDADIKGFPPAWTGAGGLTTKAVSGYIMGYRG